MRALGDCVLLRGRKPRVSFVPDISAKAFSCYVGQPSLRGQPAGFLYEYYRQTEFKNRLF